MIVRMLQKLLLLIWIATLLLASISVFLTKKNISTPLTPYLQTLIAINLMSGSLMIITWLFTVFFSMLKTISIIGIVALIILFFLSKQQWYRPKWLPLNLFQKETPVKIADTAKSFYYQLFFELFGYPTSRQMASPEELLQAVNTYRSTHGLSNLDEDSVLCEIAKKKMSDVLAVSLQKTFDEVKILTDEKDFKKVTQISQGILSANTAQTIVNLRWTNSYLPQKKVLDNPDWNVGCSAVSGTTIVFLFGMK